MADRGPESEVVGVRGQNASSTDRGVGYASVALTQRCQCKSESSLIQFNSVAKENQLDRKTLEMKRLQ